ncbi:hypothetical protein B0O80DRAFT_451977 [Mortierella sp. GBAus27b]|nr:hypothetical protein BGX31_009420 [Mortierella sp. GBA43]KAI8353401.1 hypothetical protein B0O80DRAFT_451977 [Mortierella sp. GBAus27b]
MKTTTILAFLLVMLAMMSSAFSAKVIPPIRALPNATLAFDATLDLLVQEHHDAVLNAYASIMTKADLDTEISSKIKVKITGAVKIDIGFVAKVTGSIHHMVATAVSASIDDGIKAEFTSKLRANFRTMITRRCKGRDASCLSIQAKNIVQDAAKETSRASGAISARLRANLSAKIKREIDIETGKINLWFVKIQVTGDVDVSQSVLVRLDTAVGASVQKVTDLARKEVVRIQAICAAKSS